MLLEDHRRRAVAGGVDIITGARVHSAQRLGTGWELGAGQEGFQSAVVVNAAGAWADELAVLSGVEKLGLQPYRRTAAIVDVENPLPEACPMVAAADDSFYFRPDNGQVLISPAEHVPSGPEDARPYPGDVERLDRPAQHDHDARDPGRPHGLDGAADGGGRRHPGGGVRRRGHRILLARRPGRVRLPDLLRHRRTGRRPDPGRQGPPALAPAVPRPASQSGIPDSGGAGRDPLVHPALKNGSMSTLITNIAELMTQDAEHRVLRDAAVVIEGERISWLGPAADAPAADEAVDAGGRALLPGWVDSHTHLIFAGDRTAEFEARMAGESYSAGGIAVTTGATRSTSDFDLTRLAMGRVAEAVSQGTTYLETKTGYGLDVENEARSARIASTVADEVTYLGAHLVPAGMDAEEYTELVCGPMLAAVRPYVRWADVFCEQGAFNEDQSRRVLQACKDAGLGLRVHGNQLGEGPGVRLAVEFGAASVDHVNYLSAADVDALAGSWSGWDAGRRQRHAGHRGHLPAGLRPFHPAAAGAGPGTARRRRAAGAGVQLQPRHVLHQLHGVLRHHRRAADAAERP